MYMIQLQNLSSTQDLNFAGTELPAGDIAYFPADRCTWKYINETTGSQTGDVGYAGGQYHLRQVWFYPGAVEDGVAGSLPAIRLSVANTRYILGYLGKSGRFVAITGPGTS